MADTLLITFGCSWTYGVGLNYHSGMQKEEYGRGAWDTALLETLSWRRLLSKNFGLDHVNFSGPGASNQNQFRLATAFFAGDEFVSLKKTHPRVLVLWGLTSTARNELFDIISDQPRAILYNKNDVFSKFMVSQSYNHEWEVWCLLKQIQYWDKFFHSEQIENYWFDTFNHHDYGKTQIKWSHPGFDEHNYNMIKGNDWPTWQEFEPTKCTAAWPVAKPDMDTRLGYQISDRLLHLGGTERDLASRLAYDIGFVVKDNAYHTSEWQAETDKIRFLRDHNILNPISLHPTRHAHELIAAIFSQKVKNFVEG